MQLIAANDLRAGYSAGDVLQGVSIEVNQAEIVGVLGRNGVGKTTLMRTLIGLLSARSGSIHFRGKDVTELKTDQRARLGIGYVPQGRDIFPRMTVIDNLRMGGFIRGGRAEPRLDLVHQYFPFLKERAHQIGGTLSGGQQEMLAIARALAGQPVLMLLDEPSDGVQPSIVQEIGDFILELNRKEQLAVLLVEQNIDLMRSVAERAYVMDKGNIVASLSGDALRDPENLARYLAL